MAVSDCTQDLIHDVGDNLLTEVANIIDLLEELAILAVLHDKHVLLVVFEDLKQSTNVRVVHVLLNLNLILNAGKCVGLKRILLDDFDGPSHARIRNTLFHLGYATFPDELTYLVVILELSKVFLHHARPIDATGLIQEIPNIRREFITIFIIGDLNELIQVRSDNESLFNALVNEIEKNSLNLLNKLLVFLTLPSH